MRGVAAIHRPDSRREVTADIGLSAEANFIPFSVVGCRRRSCSVMLVVEAFRICACADLQHRPGTPSLTRSPPL